MVNEVLSIDYYKKDKEMRDIIQSFHEMLDARYKEASSSLKTLFQAQTSSHLAVDNHENEDDTYKGSTTMLHVAQVHQEEDPPSYIDNPGFAIGPEDMSFGPEHDLAVTQIKQSIEQLFGASFPKSASEKSATLSSVGEKKSLTPAKGNGIAPHLCTVAWNKAPKRYQECIALVRTVDHDNQPLQKGGAEVKGTFSWSRYDKQFCKVIDNNDGTYQIIYSACSVRFHLLFVTVNGCDVAGSPFIVDVEDDDAWE